MWLLLLLACAVHGDSDGDGFASELVFGRDCNDSDRWVNPAVPDLRGDGVDRDCDGLDGERWLYR